MIFNGLPPLVQRWNGYLATIVEVYDKIWFEFVFVADQSGNPQSGLIQNLATPWAAGQEKYC